MRICIIERDDEEIRGIEWYLKNYLTRSVEIERATSCEQIVQIFSSFHPQVLLIETELITPTVQNFLQRQPCHIIALTAQPIYQQAMKAIEIKAAQLFVKPVPLEELKSIILTLPIKYQEDTPTPSITTEAQLYLDLFLNTPKKVNLKQQVFFLLEPAQFQHNLSLYNWLIQSPIFEEITAFPLQKRVLCLVQSIEREQMTKQLRHIIREWLKFSGEEMNIAIYDGEETTLSHMYNECKKVLTQRFYKGYAHIFPSSQSLNVTRLDPLLTPEAQQLLINSLENGDLKAIKSFLYKLTDTSTFYHHEDVRIHLTSVLAQIRRFMMKYHLQQQPKLEIQYRALFHHILEHPIMYAIVQELILFTQILIQQAKTAQQLHADYAEMAISIIENHYMNSTLTLKSIAKELNISANYLSNVFSKKMGIPLKKYIQQYRVQQAENMLAHSTHSIASIAEAVGFIDSNYFTKVFREYYHLTPFRYRSQSIKNTPVI
ncbi:helix-turn-helix domain-containing protein [Solibacillus sp. FSL R7-0682]|uniref:helix-turn-helix domain-containing protein n=1 Tax=Solibacillus sp. FSL R7-0682 TaxID=2921690 RepID=UPI0030F51B91